MGKGEIIKQVFVLSVIIFYILKYEEFSFSFWKPRLFVRWLIVLFSLSCLWDFPSTLLIHVTLGKPLHHSRYVVIILRKILHCFICCFPFHTMVWCDWLIVCVMLLWELWKKTYASTLWSFRIMKPLCPWNHWKFQITCFVWGESHEEKAGAVLVLSTLHNDLKRDKWELGIDLKRSW